MLERFREHLRTSGLIPEGAPVLVGYSGGSDSTCLLHLLHRCGVDVAAGHLHHGQRPEADVELKLCEAFCQELGVPFVGGRADVPRMSEELKIGLEEAGRQARYTFLRNAAFRLRCDLIATAHTRDDRVETVLFNLVRGTGIGGLAGIPERRDQIIRPLLGFSKAETRAYCLEEGLWFHDDPANEDVSFARARLRHRVLPELKLISATADVAISRLAGIAEEEDRFLNGAAAAALEQSVLRLNGELEFLTLDCEVAFDRRHLLSLPAVLLKRAVRLAVESLGGNFDYAQTQAFVTALREPKGSITSDEGKVDAVWKAEGVHFYQTAPTRPFRHGLSMPGVVSDEFGWDLAYQPARAPAAKPTRTALEAYLNPQALQGDLYFRSAKEGDAMQPYGFSGHRKLSTLLSDAKLTRAARMRLPIICDMLGPIWAPGICLDARVAASAGSGNALHLRFGPVKRAEGHNGGNGNKEGSVTHT
ncbi:MAG TPA: tRNA lysidine(34) synthetase TilS [Fimbriimonadaceae bacterium]|nr:tRNA lysidine(34) synthetase TilS [Fimbriimonadaceae bacterium]